MWSPPEHLLADCPVTPWSGEDWSDVAELAESREADLEACNQDKAALRRELEKAEEAWGEDDE